LFLKLSLPRLLSTRRWLLVTTKKPSVKRMLALGGALVSAHGWDYFKGALLMQVKDVIEVAKTLIDAAKPILEAIQEAAEKLGK